MDNLDALLKLVLCGGAAATRRGWLDAHAGDAAAALLAGTRPGSPLGAEQRARLRAPDAAALRAARDWLRSEHHHLIGWNSADYPPLLRAAVNPPLALFVAGEPTLLWHPAVAVVGSRRPTSGGRDNAREFAHALTQEGLLVASGLAAGIDAAAHETALAVDGGRTVAVLGTGPDIAYPRDNAQLHAHIEACGALVSEFAPGTPPRTEHFPSRNRILAGLALGTLVIEAAERSGALITARLAAESGREVFAVPGSIRNPLARGCHKLIRDGATLVERAGEIASALAPMAVPRKTDRLSEIHGTNRNKKRNKTRKNRCFQRFQTPTRATHQRNTIGTQKSARKTDDAQKQRAASGRPLSFQRPLSAFQRPGGAKGESTA